MYSILSFKPHLSVVVFVCHVEVLLVLWGGFGRMVWWKLRLGSAQVLGFLPCGVVPTELITYDIQLRCQGVGQDVPANT